MCVRVVGSSEHWPVEQMRRWRRNVGLTRSDLFICGAISSYRCSTACSNYSHADLHKVGTTSSLKSVRKPQTHTHTHPHVHAHVETDGVCSCEVWIFKKPNKLHSRASNESLIKVHAVVTVIRLDQTSSVRLGRGISVSHTHTLLDTHSSQHWADSLRKKFSLYRRGSAGSWSSALELTSPLEQEKSAICKSAPVRPFTAVF